MKMNHVKILSALVLGLFVLATTVRAVDDIIREPTVISKEDAAKKYPPPKGGYPTGDRPYSHTPGHILSPFAPHQEFDCSKIPRGALILDPHTKQLFVRP